ncbi:hypothetical protein [Luteibacter jiangsuensis]
MQLPWRRIVGNGALFGVIISLHLVLFVVVMSMRPRVPYAAALWARGDDATLQVRWIEAPSVARPSLSTRLASRPALDRTPHHPSMYHAEHLSSPVTIPTTAASASAAPASAPAGVPQTAPADAFGDPSIREALRNRPSGAVPTLPGGSDTPLSQALRVVPPASLRDRVKSIGSYMNCSIVEMARNRPGQLNVVRIGDAYSALGCKK